jgi:hypothetical protein
LRGGEQIEVQEDVEKKKSRKKKKKKNKGITILSTHFSI